MTSALPPIDQATLPAEVRNGTKQDKKAYEAALGFERMLLGELTKAMAETAKPIDGGDDDSSSQTQDAASSMYQQMLPDQLADAVSAGGGLGLAKSFYDTIKERS
ncbi:MAG TPA: rod-binding protein [Thermoleophilaceae bacterium]